MTTSTVQKQLWIHDNGQVCCPEHMGHYATCELARTPRARALHTPLGTWERLAQADVAQLAEMIGHEVRCEICESIERRQRRPQLRRIK